MPFRLVRVLPLFPSPSLRGSGLKLHFTRILRTGLGLPLYEGVD